MNKVLLFNPRSAVAKHRIPNSLMNIAASIEGVFEWAIVDGNREKDAFEKIRTYLSTGQYKYIGITVMPGPQTKQAIPFAVIVINNEDQVITDIEGNFSIPALNIRKLFFKAPGYYDLTIKTDSTFPTRLEVHLQANYTRYYFDRH